MANPGLFFVRVGNDPASISYVKKKEKTATSIGIEASLMVFPENIQKKS